MREKGAGSFENTRVAGVARRTAIHQCRGTRDFDREFGYPPGVINKAMVVRAEAGPSLPAFSPRPIPILPPTALPFFSSFRFPLTFFRAARLRSVPSINEHLLAPLNNKQE